MTDTGPLASGTEITEDLTLDGDIRCGAGPAIIVAADNLTLDLGGHSVTGEPAATDRGPGILLRRVSGATIRNGTVRHFDAGVVIDGGSGNVLENLTVEDNVGYPDGELGDGIVINESQGNHIRRNVVRRNGPFSGISLGPRAQRNDIRDNTVADHDMSHLGDSGAGGQDMGIRVEGPEANHNSIVGNTVTGSGGDGIVVLATCDDMDAEPPCVGTPPNERNDIVGNTANDNGRSGRGSGIRLFSMPLPMPPVHNVVRDNVADDNAWYGIAIDGLPLGSPGNTAIGNRAHRNGEFDGSDGTLMPPCGRNVWDGNDFGTVNQPGVSYNSQSAPEPE